MNSPNEFNLNQHVAEIQLTYKSKVRPQSRPKVTLSQEAHEILQQCYNPDTIELREEFKILLLNRGNRVLGKLDISVGSTVGTVVDIKFILVAVAKTNAQHVILSHNHPSGNLNPSPADKSITNKVKECLQLIDVNLLDHLILSTDSYYSFADEGLL